jgi:hypothetical protein
MVHSAGSAACKINIPRGSAARHVDFLGCSYPVQESSAAAEFVLPDGWFHQGKNQVKSGVPLIGAVPKRHAEGGDSAGILLPKA